MFLQDLPLTFLSNLREYLNSFELIRFFSSICQQEDTVDDLSPEKISNLYLYQILFDPKYLYLFLKLFIQNIII